MGDAVLGDAFGRLPWNSSIKHVGTLEAVPTQHVAVGRCNVSNRGLAPVPLEPAADAGDGLPV